MIEFPDPLFRKAVEAIDSGDVAILQHLLEAHPYLAAQRSATPADGYFAHPYLLWFVADNPIRQGKRTPGIVRIAQVIIDVLQEIQDEHYQYIIDYTLGLVATGRIPRECRVQIPLMELLVNRGAKVKGGVLGPIGQQNFEAAEWLLGKGSNYNLATAVGLDRALDIKNLAKTATPAELYVALVVAAFFGKTAVISLLIEAGADANGSAGSEDFCGFHSHASALHQAVYSGSFDAVKLLVEAGASLDVTDKVYHGSPLGWATHMQTEASAGEDQKNKSAAIAAYLRSIG